MIEAVFLFCWLRVNDGLWREDCEPVTYEMHQSVSTRDCRNFLAFKIEEVKKDGARTQLAQCVVTI